MHTLKKAINIFNLTAAIFLVVSLIFWVPMQRPALYVFFLSYFVEFFTDRKWENLKESKNKLWYIVILAFFFLAIFYYPFENTSNYFNKVMERRLPLLALSVIGLFGVNKYYRLSYFLNTFIITSMVLIGYLVFYRVGIKTMIQEPNGIELLNLARDKWVATHMIFNFYLNSALVSLWFLLSSRWNSIHKILKFTYIISFTIILFTLLISDGRSGFITGILLASSFLFVEIWRRRKLIGIVLALALPFTIFAVASQKDRIMNRLIENEPRIFLWKSAFEVIKSAPITGHGISDTQNLFTDQRTKYQTETFRLESRSYTQVDAHNQYFQTTMEFGVIGLIILMFIFIFPVFNVDKDRFLPTLFIIGMCLFQSVFDVFITNTFSLFFCFLMLMMFVFPNDLSKSETEENINLSE